ncbi:MAG: hypothetical protein OXR73_06820 [Myxococcales bacterium]|nr:hypothetical protein [Myxococcales bacterium]
MSDIPEKESSKWFVITLVGAVLYITAAFGFVTLQEIEPTEDQIQVEHD